MWKFQRYGKLKEYDVNSWIMNLSLVEIKRHSIGEEFKAIG